MLQVIFFMIYIILKIQAFVKITRIIMGVTDFYLKKIVIFFSTYNDGKFKA